MLQCYIRLNQVTTTGLYVLTQHGGSSDLTHSRRIFCYILPIAGRGWQGRTLLYSHHCLQQAMLSSCSTKVLSGEGLHLWGWEHHKGGCLNDTGSNVSVCMTWIKGKYCDQWLPERFDLGSLLLVESWWQNTVLVQIPSWLNLSSLSGP